MIEISGFGVVLLFIIGGLGFLIVTILLGKILRPTRPNAEKQTTYESGEEVSGTAWGQFNVRFYIVALVFLLFEAELIFLFPWATVFANPVLDAKTDGMWSFFSLVETFIFIAILAVGLVYVLAYKMIDWVRPKAAATSYRSPIPEEAYQKYL